MTISLKQVLAEEQIAAEQSLRELCRDIPGLRPQDIAEHLKGLLAEQDEWRARAEGIRLWAKVTGSFAPTEVAMTGPRAEDLGGIDAVLSALPKETVLALVQALRGQGNGG